MLQNYTEFTGYLTISCQIVDQPRSLIHCQRQSDSVDNTCNIYVCTLNFFVCFQTLMLFICTNKYEKCSPYI